MSFCCCNCNIEINDGHDIYYYETEGFAQVKCQRCLTTSYHCTRCQIYKNTNKRNIQRHKCSALPSITPVAPPINEEDDVAMDTSLDNNSNLAGDDTDTDMESVADEDELDELPHFEDEDDDCGIDPIVNPEDVEHDEFLQSLITNNSTTTTDDETMPTAAASHGRNYLLYSLNTFPVFQSNVKSLRFFWQDYAYFCRSGERFGGLRGIAWRSAYRVNACDDESSLLPLEDAALMFKMMDHALNNKGGAERSILQHLVWSFLQALTHSIQCCVSVQEFRS